MFNDKLASSLSQIQRAQEAMEHLVKQDTAQQHVDLIQEYTSVMDEFKKAYGMLAEVQDKTQLKIKQVTGLRDGVCYIVFPAITLQTWQLTATRTTLDIDNHKRNRHANRPKRQQNHHRARKQHPHPHLHHHCVPASRPRLRAVLARRGHLYEGGF